VFENIKNLRNCSCVADCSKVQYDYYVIKKSIDPKEICGKRNESPFIEDYLRSYMVIFLNKINSIKWVKSSIHFSLLPT